MLGGLKGCGGGWLVFINCTEKFAVVKQALALPNPKHALFARVPASQTPNQG